MNFSHIHTLLQLLFTIITTDHTLLSLTTPLQFMVMPDALLWSANEYERVKE